MDGGKGSTDKEIKFPNCAADVRIVVFDDDLARLRTVSSLLGNLSYQVMPFQSAADALCALRLNAKPTDLIISAIHMASMNGLEFMEVIRREFQLPVILMSEDDDWRFIADSIRRGALFYVVLPDGLSELKYLWQLLRSWKCCRLSTRYKKIPDLRPSKGAIASEEVSIYWTDEWFHRAFLDCIDHLGPENVTLEELVKLLDIDGLTTDDVAFHLQVYRACLEYPDPTIQQPNQANVIPPANPVQQAGNDQNSENPILPSLGAGEDAHPESCGSCSVQQFSSNRYSMNHPNQFVLPSLGAGDPTPAESSGSCSRGEDDVECVNATNGHPGDHSVTSKAKNGTPGDDD